MSLENETTADLILVRHGLRRVEVPRNGWTTVADALADAGLRDILKFGDNVQAKSGSTVLEGSDAIPNGGFVIETKANSKA